MKRRTVKTEEMMTEKQAAEAASGQAALKKDQVQQEQLGKTWRLWSRSFCMCEVEERVLETIM